MSRKLLFLGIIILSSGALSVFMLERDHGWGDDFAAYIMQAQAIAGGGMAEFIQMSTFTARESGYRFVGPITAPWGFPLLLAPVAAIFGTKILAFKLVLTLCHLLFLIAFYFLARTRLQHLESLLLTSVLAFNPMLLRAQNEILPDIPFLLLSTLSLYLIERYVNTGQSVRPSLVSLATIGLVIFMAAFTRANGFLLLLPLIAGKYMVARQRPKDAGRPRTLMLEGAIPFLVVAVCYSAQALILPSVGSRLQSMLHPGAVGGLPPQHTGAPSLQDISSNLVYYFWLPEQLTQHTVYQGQAVYVALLAFCAVAMVRGRRQDIPIFLYVFATMIFFVGFGGRQGVRYVYPVLPILLLFSFQGMKVAAGWINQRWRNHGMRGVYLFWAGLALASIAASADFALKNMAANRMLPGRWDGAFSPGSTLMFDFVRHHTPEDSVIIFFKPRAMRLRTHRNSFMALECESFSRGNYLVVMKGGGTYNQVAPESVESCKRNVALTRVYDEDDFIIYEILPTR